MSQKEEILTWISEWNKYKNIIAEHEKKMEIYKNKVIEYMKDNELSTINTTDFSVKQSKYSRETLSKKDLPSDIWNKYCKSSSYYIYKLTEK